MATPLDTIAEGAKLNPGFAKLVVGIPMALAALALGVSYFREQPAVAYIGVVAVLALCVVVWAVSRLGEGFEDAAAIKWFVRAILAIFVLVIGLIVSCTFADVPKPVTCLAKPMEPCSRLTAAVTAPPPQPPAPPPPAAVALATAAGFTVYVQFAGYARPTIESWSSQLRARGWSVPGEERLGSAARLNEIRYGDDADKPAADLLAADYIAMGKQVQVRKVGIIKPGTLEVWISR